jgi:hypothetical protein
MPALLPFGTLTELTDDWVVLNTSLDIQYTLRNVGSNPIGIAYTTLPNPPIHIPVDDILQLGGFTDTVTTPLGKYTWFKAMVGTPIHLRYVTIGTLDPDADVGSLSTLLADLITEFYTHTSSVNPHHVTQDQIGLSDIPNNITTDKNNNQNNVLATTAMVHNLVNDVISTIITPIKNTLEVHINNFYNPHQVTKAQVGLDKVLNETIYMPKAIIPSLNVAPHILYSGPTRILPSGWTVQDADMPTNHITLLNNNTIRVHQNLQVTYTFDSRVYLSAPLAQNFDITIPTTNTTYYIYAELYDSYLQVDSNDHGKIQNIFLTNIQPTTHTQSNQGVGDWFKTSTYQLLDINNDEFNRVYIGQVTRLNSVLQTPIGIPIGNRYIAPVPEWYNLSLGLSTIIPNPFIYDVTTQAQVNNNGEWEDTRWNDQIGVQAQPLPGDNSKILVQVGLMGWLASSPSSGNSFQSPYTVTTPLQTRVIIQRVF